ncbi:MAG: OPT family oligopeptide transporter, partial [Acetobacteraceae bacterium]
MAIPLLSHGSSAAGMPPAVAAQHIWSGQVRYLGVGAMLVGGAATLWRLRRAILHGFGAARMMGKARGAARSRQEMDLAPRTITTASALCAIAIFGVVYLLSGGLWLSLVLALLVIAIGFFATAVAGYLTGIVGSSNNPVSGVTIIVLLLLALLLRAGGVGAAIGPQLAILVGAVICTAAAMAGESLHDLATGFHLGATPRALEIAVVAGAVVASFVMAPVLNLLLRAYGIAGTAGAGAHALAAPQAFLMAKVAQGVFRGGLPWGMIASGGALAVALLLADRELERRGARWRTPVMPVAIGLYLPFGLGVTILAGGIIRRFTAQSESASGRGVLLAAGLIAGEALTGLLSGALITAGVHLPLV